MRQTVHVLAAGAAFAIYAAVGATAFAQPSTSAATSPAQPPGRAGMHAETQAERAERLRAILQLRPAQEPALQAYVAALEAAHHGMMMDGRAQGSAPATTPERLARMQQMMDRHRSAMTALIDATRRFYGQLDAPQKRAFDALPMMTMHGGMGGMGGMRMMRMGEKGHGSGADQMRMAPANASPPR